MIRFSIGNEHNPADPFGRVVITIDPDDVVTLEHFSRQGNATYTANLAPDVTDEITSAVPITGRPSACRPKTASEKRS